MLPAVWKLQDAKARFSELVRRARAGEPQHVTVHGEEAVVVVDPKRYEIRPRVAAAETQPPAPHSVAAVPLPSPAPPPPAPEPEPEPIDPGVDVELPDLSDLTELPPLPPSLRNPTELPPPVPQPPSAADRKLMEDLERELRRFEGGGAGRRRPMLDNDKE